MGSKRPAPVTLAEIEQASGPVARNRARTSLSAFFSYAVREGLIDGLNPVSGTAKATENGGRDRVLTQNELAQVLAALNADPGPFSDILHILILTGQRRSEIGGLLWKEVDLERGLIIFPPERCKNGRQHELPISSQLKAILERQPKRNEWVWGCRWTSWSEPKVRLDKRLNGIAPWRLHDLRRSAATHLGELGVLPHLIEQILNHQSGHRAGVAGVYQRSKYPDQVREALQMWGTYVEGLTATAQVE